MNEIKQFISLSLIPAVGFSVGVCQPAIAGESCSADKKISQKASKDIVDTAVSAGSFGTLVTALKEAGLVSTLKGDGPFTVFAPSDEAFAKIPKKDLNALLKDKKKLTKVLTYHVVPGSVKAKQVLKLKKAKTVEGENVKISTRDGGVKVDQANVVKTDILCKNGVIHVIDQVIMPENI